MRVEQARTEDGIVVARVDADRDNATPVIMTYQGGATPSGRSAAADWRYRGTPPDEVFVDRSGHTPTPKGWQHIRLVMPGEHYADLHRPGVAGRKWSISKLDGSGSLPLPLLPAVVRYAKLASGAVADEAAAVLDALGGAPDHRKGRVIPFS